MSFEWPEGALSLEDFDALFESVKNWGRWGTDDRKGTLNLITPQKVRQAAALVRSGRRVSMQVPIETSAGPDNPNPAIHFVSQGHDIDIGSAGLRFGLDFFGMTCHGDCHTHADALCHVSYKGVTYGGRTATDVLTTKGATSLGVESCAEEGLVGRGVLLDMARHRRVEWLEPGEVVTRDELEACERAEGVRVDEGDVLLFRTGHHARRRRLGPRNNDYPPGEGRAGLDLETIPWMRERGVAAFLADFDGEVVPSAVKGMLYPIHVLQIVAMGMLTGDLVQLEELSRACEQEGRWEFMVVGLPLHLVGATGSPWNPLAIL